MSTEYRFQKKFIAKAFFLNSFKNEMDILKKYCDYSGEGIYIDENGRLCWYWEYDNDFGGSDGVMPFCYTEAEAGKTWAFSEVKSLLSWLYDFPEKLKFPSDIINDLTLLQHIRKNKLPIINNDLNNIDDEQDEQN